MSVRPGFLPEADEVVQEMIKDKSKLRQGEKNYHDIVFEQEVNDLIIKTKQFYAE